MAKQVGIQLLQGNKGYKQIGTVDLPVVKNKGWEKVRYKGCWHQLYAGRGGWFINTDHPITCVRRRKAAR